MEIPKLKKKLASIIQKYKFVLLILCVGMILILLPTESKSTTNIISGEQAKEPEHISQKELASILSRISGAGRVEVLLATEAYGKTDYQVNVDSSASSGERITTVTVTDAQRNQCRSYYSAGYRFWRKCPSKNRKKSISNIIVSDAQYANTQN